MVRIWHCCKENEGQAIMMTRSMSSTTENTIITTTTITTNNNTKADAHVKHKKDKVILWTRMFVLHWHDLGTAADNTVKRYDRWGTSLLQITAGTDSIVTLLGEGLHLSKKAGFATLSHCQDSRTNDSTRQQQQDPDRDLNGWPRCRNEVVEIRCRILTEDEQPRT